MDPNEEKLRRVDTFFDQCPVLQEDLKFVHEFAFAVQHANVSSLKRPEYQVLIADHLAQEISSFVTAQGLHHLDELQPEADKETGQINVTYGDDIYHFRVSLNDHLFALVRKNSTVHEFHQFYRTFAPFFPELYRSTVSKIEGTSSFKIAPFLCAFRFKLNLSSFQHSARGGKRIQNYELMSRIVPLLPDQDGAFPQLYAEQIARTDLKVSFWKGFNGKLRNCWYDIQAPGNRCWTTLELAFSYQGSTHTDPQGKRSPFDPEIMEEWDIALIDFFKGQALNRFLSGWLDNVSFISE